MSDKRISPAAVRTAALLLDHLRMRKSELEQVGMQGGALTAIVLHFGSERLTIHTAADISDNEGVVIAVLDSLTEILRNSVQATRDHLLDLGVEA